MTCNIQAPAKGEPLRASWAGDVTRVLNAFPDKVGASSRNNRQFPICDVTAFRLGYGPAYVDDGEGGTTTETHLFLRDCRFMWRGDYSIAVNASVQAADFGSVDIDSMYGLIALKVYTGPNSNNYGNGTGEVVAIAGQTLYDAMVAADFNNGGYRFFPLWFRSAADGFTADLRCCVRAEPLARPWVWNGDSFENAYVQVGRSLINVISGNSGITSAGNYYVHVSHPTSGSYSASVVLATGNETNDEDNTYLLVAELVADANNVVHQHFGIYAYPIVYLYEN